MFVRWQCTVRAVFGIFIKTNPCDKTQNPKEREREREKETQREREREPHRERERKRERERSYLYHIGSNIRDGDQYICRGSYHKVAANTH